MMKVASMTGFGKSEATHQNYILKIEVKSVNNRYKDIRFKLPHSFSQYEMPTRKMIDSKFRRGSFEVSAYVKHNQDFVGTPKIDYKKVNAFLDEFCQEVKIEKSQLSFSPTQFMKGDFYVEEQKELESLYLPTLQKALEDFAQSRVEEGIVLGEKLLGYLSEYENEFATIKKEKESLSKNIKQRIEEKFSEFKEQVDDERRFAQEIIYYLEKADIDEEIIRIEAHLNKLKDLIKNGGEIGRKLDFFIQELNRETNTIGSKSNSKTVSNSVIEMKARIEKIREQALNLE